MAAGLSRGGLAPGQAVAALVEDDAPAVVLVHAARRLGAVLVPLNRRAAPPELAVQLRAAAPALLVHDTAARPRAHEVAAMASLTTTEVERLLEDQPGGPGRAGSRCAAPALVDPASPATLVFTSGTTGRPRGALLTHANHAASADAWASVLGPRASDRWLACLPLFHVAGLAIVVRASRWQVPLEVVARFEAHDIVQRIRAGISHLSLVPTQLEQLLAAWDGRSVPTTLRAILLGGAPIPGATLARARAAGLPVLTTYGMTETSSGVAVGGGEPATLADPAALRPLPGVDVRVVDPGAEDGVGDILVRGAMVCRGYLGDPEASAERLVDGWLRTGDLGSLDAEGLLRIADRREDLIISGGENVYPAEVEAVLREHPAVVDAAVLGRPDRAWGSVPVAAVVVAPGLSVSDAELVRHCRDRLAGYKVPVHFRQLASLPRNEAGKLVRRELRDLLGEAGT
jgi:O-succinylbenzoic acid--CoA ligase